jgi:hypothetical protein
VAPVDTSAISLFTTQVPTQTEVTDQRTYELGMAFRSTSAGTISAIRYWKSASDNGSHTGRLWSASGELLASAVFSGESASGWQQTALSSPLAILANTTYVVSVNTNSHYVLTNGGLASAVIRAPLQSEVGGNGRYGDLGTFPTQSWNDSNYFRDVVFSANGGNQPPSISRAATSAPAVIILP